MAISCEPKDLMEAAKCYSTIPTGKQMEVMIYLLNQISGLDLTPKELMEAAKCFETIPKGKQNEIITYLLCQNANGGSGGNIVTTPAGLENELGTFIYGDIPTLTKLSFNQSSVIAGFDLESTTTVTEIDFPNLVSIDPLDIQSGSLIIAVNSSLSAIKLDQLSYVSYTLTIGGNVSLLSLDLHSLVHVGGTFRLSGNSNLASVDLSSYVPTDGKAIDLTGCALNAATIELILRRCVLAGVTTCTISLQGGTNAGTASLNAQGQADVATLGAQLTINP